MNFEPTTTLNVLDVHSRPAGCSGCSYSGTGLGFCPDWIPERPRIGLLLEAAGATEIEEKMPLSGGTGRWLWWLIESLGFSRADVAVFNTLRCHPPGNSYPVARGRKEAELSCRQYDGVHGTGLVLGGVADFEPDVMILSFHPAAVLRSNNLAPLLGNRIGSEHTGVLAKAFRFAAAGRRPVVVMGDKAKELVAPEFGEGITKWVGHVQELGAGEWRRRLGAVGRRDNMALWWREVRGGVGWGGKQ